MKFFATLNRSRKRDRQRRLLLMRLEAAMPNGHLIKMTDDATVEHILPRGSQQWWNERFPDPALRSELANLLGNLTLITYDQNKEADTKPYPKKRTIYFDTRGAPIHALTKDIGPIEEWTLQAIEGVDFCIGCGGSRTTWRPASRRRVRRRRQRPRPGLRPTMPCAGSPIARFGA
jgi:hypothetical protein